MDQKAARVTISHQRERFTRHFFTDKVKGSFVRMWAKKRSTTHARGTLLHLNNVRPHLASETFEHDGIPRLLHPAYNPDLPPAGFWLSGRIKARLEGFFFQDINEATDMRVVILRSIPPGLLSGYLTNERRDWWNGEGVQRIVSIRFCEAARSLSV
jgi:hypothetical protein